MESKSFVIKLKYGNDLRRMTFEKPELNFAGLVKSFTQIYPNFPLAESVHFEVNGDTAVITNEEEFSRALDKHNSSSSNKVFQVTAITTPTTIPSPTTTTNTPNQSQQSNFKASSNPKPSLQQEENLKKTANSFLQSFLGMSENDANELSSKGLGIFNDFILPKCHQKEEKNVQKQATPDTFAANPSSPFTTTPDKAVVESKREELMKMKSLTLKESLNELGVNCDDVVEKQELVDRLLKRLGSPSPQQQQQQQQTVQEEEEEEEEPPVFVIPISFKSLVNNQYEETTTHEEKFEEEVPVVLLQPQPQPQPQQPQPQPQQPTGTTEHPFVAKLKTLNNLGFTDKYANIQALVASEGDIPKAIESLLVQLPQ